MTALPEIPDENSVFSLGEKREAHRSISPRGRKQDLALHPGDTQGGVQPSASIADPLPRHQSSKSFSTLNQALSELRLVSQRASLSLRRKNILSPRTPNLPSEKQDLTGDERPSTSCNTAPKPSSHSRASVWLRRAASTSFRHRRDSSTLPSPTYDHKLYNYNVTSPVPGSGSEPPILPYDPASGAAARAAAAAQNEMLGAGRVLLLRDETRLGEPKLTRDSESGIGIDIRDRTDDTAESQTAVVRKDPTSYLPAELIAHVLSYLDSTSLMKAELVSRTWHSAAISHHVWKHIFQGEYSKSIRSVARCASANVGGVGMGRLIPDQDWKRMFHLRKALEARWIKGAATAIYLEGHKDSVYCVQFDEHKIITGSRDQTIRVWDVHTFECIKVIGAPSPRSAADSRASPAPSSEYHRASILSLQFDKEILVTGSSDWTCIVWDIQNDYKPIHRLRNHTAGVLDVCFDDKHIVSCSKDTTLCVWDRRTGELLKRLVGHRGPVNAVQLRGNLAVSASGDGIAKLWNLTSGLCIKEFPSKDRGLACIEFSEDARTILAGGNDQVIYRFDANTGELINELKGHKGLVRSLHLDGTNGRIISGSYDMSVKVFDFETGNLIIDFPGWTTSWMLSAKADYRRIVATSQDSRAVIMDFGFGLSGIEMLEG
ncbi:MAG: hypothetical protein M1830_001178 [Pleopsidium flavum]|nr:MAG: hypothetical protein M1830_001178 [Pleopsidium flavum]